MVPRTHQSKAQRVYTVTTPEGVPLPFVIAPLGDRCGAFVLDLLVITVGTIAVVAFGLLIAAGAPNLGLALILFAAFIVRNFYFTLCEVNWGGKTVGKRAARLRVISRDGGPLSAEAVLARNLTREVEFFLPLAVLVAGPLLASGIPAWALLAATAWLFVAATLPFFGKDRLRCGDLVAGTLVVRAPEAVLLPDLAGAGAGGGLPPEFTREQLDIYGIQELQVLEDVLRRHAELREEMLDNVADRIRRKISWPVARWREPSLPFLQAFYRAQRAQLEQKMLFGERQETKRSLNPPSPRPPGA